MTNPGGVMRDPGMGMPGYGVWGGRARVRMADPGIGMPGYGQGEEEGYADEG